MRRTWMLVAGLIGLSPFALASKTLVVALPPATKITYLQPLAPGDVYTFYDSQASLLLYRPLLWIDRNIQIDYARSIASSVRSQDGKHYLVTLHRRWRWSDGKPVTAQDVAFALDLLRSVPASNVAADANWGIGGMPQDIRSVKVLGEWKLEITLNGRYNTKWFLYNGLAQIVPLPQQAWDRYPGQPAKTLAYLQREGDNLNFFRGSPVDGPFRVGRFRAGQSYRFLANPEYAGRKPDYQQLELAYFTNSDAEFNALRAGEVQVGYLPAHLYGQQGSLPSYRLIAAPQWSVNYLYLNFKASGPGKALRLAAVRQALQMAVDQPAILRVILHGQGNLAYGPVPYRPSTYLSPYLLTHVPYPYDPAAGRRLLEKAGFRGRGGVMQRGRLSLRFTLQYASGIQSIQLQDELIAAAAAREGIRIQLKPVPFDTLLGELGSPKGWSMVDYGGWSYQPDFYPTSYGLFGSKGGSNLSGYADPAVDRLAEATHRFGSPAQEQGALNRYQNALAEKLPVIWLPASAQLNEVSEAVAGFHYNPTGNWSPERWQLR